MPEDAPKKKCPKWDCEGGFYKVLKAFSNGSGFYWKDIRCPICNGTGYVQVDPA